MNTSNRHIETGKLGEDLAVAYLLPLGFSILQRNWRYRRLEVDIIVSKDDILHFIEVKTRTSSKYGLPETAVSAQKMKLLKNAAEEYQYLFPQWKKVQFDIVAVLLHQKNVQEIYINWDVYF